MTAFKLSRNHRSGFALVSAVSVLALLLLIGLAILSLSTSTTRESKVDRHAEIARANARMALAIAIAQLQEAMGPDQRVSATADILANSNAPLPGREKWLGVWKTTHKADGDQEYPLVGKAPSTGEGPYESDAYYEDLRHTNSDLSNDQWKEKLHMSWLASGDVDAHTEFSGETLQVLSARGQEEAVEVGLVSVEGNEGSKGNYAWWIADNSMKAALGTQYDPDKSVGLAIAPYAEPASVAPLNPTGEGSQFASLTEDPEARAKYATYSSIQLAHKGSDLKQALKDSFHDFTTQSFGMPIDTAMGGFKKDLTPLLQGDPNQQRISFTSPSEESVFPSPFDSSAPIIPGRRHAVFGPKFASMRHWVKFSMDNPNGFNAETESRTSGAVRARDGDKWIWATNSNFKKSWLADHETGSDIIKNQYEKADGSYFDEEKWSEGAPKFHPVMTDARWHYYVNVGFKNPADPNASSITDEGFMSHIVPRVCLWNPYSRAITFDRLVVMMPNPMAQGRGNVKIKHGNSWGVRGKAYTEFNKLKEAGAKGLLTGDDVWKYQAWGALQFYDGTITLPRYSGQRSKNNDPQSEVDNEGDGSEDRHGLFPSDRYLAFVIEATTIEPGENLVFSPKVDSSDYDGSVDALQNYVKTNIENHILSADSAPGVDHYVHLCQRDSVGFVGRPTGTFNTWETGSKTKVKLTLSKFVKDNSAFNWLKAPEKWSDDSLRPQVARTISNGKSTNSYLLPTSFYIDYLLKEEYKNNSLFKKLNYDQLLPSSSVDASFSENMPYILKSAPADATGLTVDTLLDSGDFPTLQLMHHGNGGAVGSYYSYGSSNIGTFEDATGEQGKIGMYTEATPPLPATHFFGTKLLWFDESLNEAGPNAIGDWGQNLLGSAPYRSNYWGEEDLAFNAAPIANWNMRAGLVMRSPATPTVAPDSGERWQHPEVFGTTNGAWALQTNPDVRGGPNGSVVASGTDNLYKKNPFGSQAQGLPQQAVLFDFADSEYGALSIGELRHAPLSQYSFHPTYIVGGSLSDIHSSRERTAVELFDKSDTSNALKRLLGGGNLSHGPVAGASNDKEIRIDAEYDSMYRAGSYSATANLLGENVNSDKEIPFYDIVYEVNHNLWDRFFVSGMKMNSANDAFVINKSDVYWNQRHLFNPSAKIGLNESKSKLEANDGLKWGFWHNGAVTMIDGQFNVNSTSVNAWKAFLSANKRLAGTLMDGTQDASDLSKFFRVQNPLGFSEEGALDTTEAWNGGRGLSDSDITLLAGAIVNEVKLRGPFISLSDFVNRRLTSEDEEPSRMGALDSAIFSTPINSSIDSVYNIDPTGGGAADNNSNEIKSHYAQKKESSTLPMSRGYGLPGYLTQGDILESHGFAMSARGETFTIRAYGESRGTDDVVMAKAWLEAVVVRTPEYIQGGAIESYGQNEGANSSLDVAQMLDYRSGELTIGDLSVENAKFGRRFKVISCKWLSNDDDFEL